MKPETKVTFLFWYCLMSWLFVSIIAPIIIVGSIVAGFSFLGGWAASWILAWILLLEERNYQKRCEKA